MSSTRQQVFDSKDWRKTRELAASCLWLAATLDHQQRLLTGIDVLSRAGDASTWLQRWSALDRAVAKHLALEQTVLAPAILQMGQRMHAVLSDVRREQIRQGLEDLRCPSWEDGCSRLERFRVNLVSHFCQEESWSYHALARNQGKAAELALTAGCVAIIGEADPCACADQAVEEHIDREVGWRWP